MTSPTDIPTPAQPAPAEEGSAELTLRRTLRTASGETYEIVGGPGQERVGAVQIHYADDAVEGLLALPAVDGDAVRGILGWVTDLLQLDTAAGPGGSIHWVVTTGEIEDFWRRSPGRRPTGAETDVATARAQVEQVLGAMFPSVEALPEGAYAVDAGSVRVFVGLRASEGPLLVRVFSLTNVDVPVEAALTTFLLDANREMPLGRFSLDVARRSVWLDHVLGADELDVALPRTVAAIAQNADRYDDEIKRRFGGRTFREEGSPVEAVAAETGMAGGYL